MRKFLAVALLSTVLSLAPGAAHASRADAFRLLTNRARVTRELPPLRVDRELRLAALRHSRRMAAQHRLYHTRCLPCQTDRSWSVLGENVGVGGTVRSVQGAFMASKGHRANVLYRHYDSVGIGVVKDGDYLWVTVIFRGRS